MSNLITHILIAIAILIPVQGQCTIAATAGKTQKYFEEMVKRPGFEEAAIAAMAVTADGDTLLCWNSNKMLIPASTMKLITTGTSLKTLGADYKWRTELKYSGEITPEGILKGDLYIIGHGDPLLGAKDEIAQPIETTFNEWITILRKNGIKRIDGCVIGDRRSFEGPQQEQSWQYEDIGTDYGAGTCGLNFYQNRQDFVITPGKAEGEPVGLSTSYPLSSTFKVINSATTGPAGTGDKTFLFNSFMTPKGELRGTFAIDRKTKTLHCSNHFPDYTCAVEFNNYLNNAGIKTTGKPTSATVYFGSTDLSANLNPERKECQKVIATSSDLKLLGATESDKLEKVVTKTNYDSNNFYAETLFRTVAEVKTGQSDYNSARMVMAEQIASMGLGRSKGEGTGIKPDDLPNGLCITDGSGLSRKNLVSPAFFCKFLGAMMDDKVNFDTYLNSLPYPGSEGTMKYRMKSYPELLKKRIRYKSGTMEGVRCFTGYILPTSSESTVIFSIMVNGYTISSGSIQTLIDHTIANLADEIMAINAQ